VKGCVNLGRPVHYRCCGIGSSGSLHGLRARGRRRRHIAEAISFPGLVGNKPKWIIIETRSARLFWRLMEHVNVPTPSRRSSWCSVRWLSVCQSLTDLGKSKDSAGMKSVSSAMIHHSTGVASEIAQSNQGRERETGKRAHSRPAQMDSKEKRNTVVERSTKRAPSPVQMPARGRCRYRSPDIG
jgi:hypothetical protein